LKKGQNEMTSNADDYNLDPLDPFAYTRERAEHLRKRYGADSEPWDKDFGGLDLGAEQARKASKELRDSIAANSLDPERPLRFSVRIANRDVALQITEQDGRWFTNMPIEVSPQRWEWRRLEADSYDDLLASITRNLRAGPQIQDLSPEDELRLARACVPGKKQDLAAVLEEYLRLRLGPGADATTLDDPRYARVVDESVLFIFAHSEPTFPNTPQAIEYIKRYANGRPLNIKIARAAFAEFQKHEKSAEQLAAVPQVTEQDLVAMSDKDIEKTLTAVSREHADTERRRRDLLRYDSRQEYRRAEDVIKQLHDIED
jgi:hypothetical protein